MADRFVEVTKRGWGSRLMSSFGGVIIGFILFLLAFVVLWQNEGRTDLSKIAYDSVPVAASSVDPAHEGEFVAATGTLQTEETLGDGEFLRPGDYIHLEREVEMFAWVERTSSETERNTGGSEETTTEYTYEETWTSSPRDSGNFRIPAGHENPPLTIEDESHTVSSATVGAYSINPQSVSLPSADDLSLAQRDLMPGAEGRVTGEYLFLGDGSLQRPEVGDMRIRYEAVPSGIQVTAFGKQQGDTLVPYLHRGETRLYSLHATDRESAIAGMAAAHKTTGWILRLVGFGMMWFGLTLILGPISTFLDVLPILGSLSRTMLGILTFGVALVLSLITIVVSAIAHNLIALIILLVIILGGVWLIGQRRRAAETPAAA